MQRLCDDGPMSITRLTTEAGADATRQAVTKHLRVIADARVDLERISRRWDEAIDRLRTFVENAD